MTFLRPTLVKTRIHSILHGTPLPRPTHEFNTFVTESLNATDDKQVNLYVSVRMCVRVQPGAPNMESSRLQI